MKGRETERRKCVWGGGGGKIIRKREKEKGGPLE